MIAVFVVLGVILFFAGIESKVQTGYVIPRTAARRKILDEKRAAAQDSKFSPEDKLRWYSESYLSWQGPNGSKAGTTVAKKYLKIPAEYRPISESEILSILKALDVRYEAVANKHSHGVEFWDEPEFNNWYWHCDCQNDNMWHRPSKGKKVCALWDSYGQLACEFTLLKAKIDEQNRQMRLLEMPEHRPEHIAMVLDRLRVERGIVGEVTKELVHDDPLYADKLKELEPVKTMREKILEYGLERFSGRRQP